MLENFPEIENGVVKESAVLSQPIGAEYAECLQRRFVTKWNDSFYLSYKPVEPENVAKWKASLVLVIVYMERPRLGARVLFPAKPYGVPALLPAGTSD